MDTGQKISAVAHVGLVGWALLGGVFTSEPLPFEITEVSVVSGEEYAAMIAQQNSPEAATDVAKPAPPPEEGTLPEATPQADQTLDVSTPAPTPVEAPDDAPDAPELPVPPVAEVSDAPPVMQPPAEDIVSLVPTRAVRPKARPAPRVAPTPVAQPEPETQVDDIAQEEVALDETSDTRRDEAEATAPEEATDAIVPETQDQADVASTAPTMSRRPKARPRRAVQPETSDAVSDAVAEALGGGADEPEAAPRPSGPPMTGGEKDALRVAVSNCWNVGSLSSEALKTTVVVQVLMDREARPQQGGIKMISHSGGSAAAANQAFQAARRAIIRCGSRGYNLPIEKYDHWREIEMTFNPEKMRIK